MNTLIEQVRLEIAYRGYSSKTEKSYCDALQKVSRFFNKPLDKVSTDELNQFFKDPSTRRLSRSSQSLIINSLAFLYKHILKRALKLDVALPKAAFKAPAYISRSEIQALIAACDHVRVKTLIMLCYGCGLRISEALQLKVADIDSERNTLYIEHGKGKRARYVVLPPSVLAQLRVYWLAYRPTDWLFYAPYYPQRPISASTFRKPLRALAKRCGVSKAGHPHALRHAFATHQLEAGMPLHQLQHQLGHQDIRTTEGYLHWLPELGHGGVDLLAPGLMK